MRPNFRKRADVELDAIREVASGLPTWQRNRILNRCDKLAVLYRKQANYGPQDPTPSQQHDAIADRAKIALKILDALLDGETLCFRDGDRFGTSQFHTQIVAVRRLVEKRHPKYVFRSEWRRAANYNYKIYWLDYKI